MTHKTSILSGVKLSKIGSKLSLSGANISKSWLKLSENGVIV